MIIIVDSLYSRKLFISERFNKQIRSIKEFEEREKIIQKINQLAYYIDKEPQKVTEWLQQARSKKFNNMDYWKFYANSSQRILFAYGKDIDDERYYDSIFIIKFLANHDTQTKEAAIIKGQIQQFEEYIGEPYEIEKEITYIASENSISNLSKYNNPEWEVLLNNEQQECIQVKPPLLLNGSAGSGKTLVSIELVKQHIRHNIPCIYFTLTEGLSSFTKELVEEQIQKPMRCFYSISHFCMENLKLEHCNYIQEKDFYEQFYEVYIKRNYNLSRFNKEDIWAEIRGIIKGYMYIDWDRDLLKNQLIDKEIYLDMKEEKCRFLEEDKEKLYKLAEQYQEWLTKHNKFDDNDLARGIVKLIKQGTLERLSIIVDEVQDLTEVQAYMIFEMALDLQVYLCGDSNQIIHPTLFDFSRLTTFLYLSGIQDRDIRTLKKNYRSSSQIVEYLNKMVDLRRKKIGTLKQKFEKDEVAIRVDKEGDRLFNIRYDKNEIKTLVELCEDRPHTAVLVFNDESKKKIEQILQRESKRIFTIYEAKGLEFNYIICINLLSDCEQQWEEIMCNLGEGSSRHRFYFNVLYVALTRAREYIYSIEEKDTCQNLLEKILSTQIDTIDIVEIADFNAEEWLEEGKRFEKVDDYVRAISAYIKYRDLVGSFDQSNIIRCQAKQLRYRNKTIEGYNQAGVKFLSINMLEEARDAFRLGKNQMKVLEVEIRMGNKTQEVINSFRQYIKEGLTDEGFLETYIQHFVTTRIHDQKQNIQLIQAQIKELSKGV